MWLPILTIFLIRTVGNAQNSGAFMLSQRRSITVSSCPDLGCECSVAAQLHTDRGEAASHARTQRGNNHICHALPYRLHGRQDHEARLYKWHYNPNVQTAEGGKENSRSKGQGDSQEQRQELVNHIFADFKEGVAADPYFV